MMLSLLFLTATAHSSDHQTLSGERIVQRSQAAYDAVKTLTEDVTSSQSGTGTRGMGVATAHIQFKRAGQLRVTGKAMFGAPYQLLIDGKSVSVFNGGQWNASPSPEIGIAICSGLSLYSAAAVPSALLHLRWGSLRTLGQPERVVRDSVKGRPTYRLEFSQPFKRKVWFDASSYFLVKSEMAVMKSTITLNFGTPVVNQPISGAAFRK